MPQKSDNTMKTSTIFYQLHRALSRPIIWVFAGSLGLRIYSLAMRCIINPDGAQYLYQASAIFDQRWSDLLICKLSYISPLPFLIAPFFKLAGNWIVAGQLVNILFGWAALVPLYFLLSRFVNATVSTLTVLIFGLIPILVEVSSEVLREPFFWFCLSMGMLMFVRQWDQKAQTRRFRIDLLVSCLFFILATWARIEGVAFLLVTAFYVLISGNDSKIQRLIFFLLPLILLGLTAIGVTLFSGKAFSAVLRFKQVFHEATNFGLAYSDLATQIAEAFAQQSGIYGEFLRRSKEVMAFIPLIMIAVSIVEGIFYPYALIYLFGFVKLRKKYQNDQRIGYFICLTLVSLVVFYIHIINTWIFTDRFLAILIFPGCVIMATGIETALGCFTIKRRWQTNPTVWVIIIFLVLFGLIENLKPKETDKIVYREAAAILAHYYSGSNQPISISAVTASRGFEWILLYALGDKISLPCANSLLNPVPDHYKQFVSSLDKAQVECFFYEERYWPKDKFDLLSAPISEDFNLLGKWYHSDSQQFMLLQRKVD